MWYIPHARVLIHPVTITGENCTMADLETNKLLMVIIAILLPPVAVGLKRGIGLALVINIILCLLFFLPGLIHALWVVLS